MPEIRSAHAAVSLLVATLSWSAFAAEPATVTNIPTANLAWDETEEGVAFAALVGDRFVESYMAMVRLPAGLISPPHVKSANMFGVVISGTISHLAIDSDPSDEILLPEGSFYQVPAGLAHVSKCVSETDCVTFLYQDGKFDFLPTTQ